MAWIISTGWKVGRFQGTVPTEHFSGYQYFVVDPSGRMVPCGFGDDGKNLAEMIVQGMNEASERYTKKTQD